MREKLKLCFIDKMFQKNSADIGDIASFLISELFDSP